MDIHKGQKWPEQKQEAKILDATAMWESEVSQFLFYS